MKIPTARFAILPLLALAAGCGDKLDTDPTQSGALTFGAVCTSDHQCETGLCRSFGGARLCSESCSGKASGAACSYGGVCLIEGEPDNFCVPACTEASECTALNPGLLGCVATEDAGGEMICSPEAPVTPDKQLGEACDTHAECASGMCFRGWGEGFCSMSCTGMNEGASCDVGGACLIEGEPDNVCLPACNQLSDCTAINPMFTECRETTDSGGIKICLP